MLGPNDLGLGTGRGFSRHNLRFNCAGGGPVNFNSQRLNRGRDGFARCRPALRAAFVVVEGRLRRNRNVLSVTAAAVTQL